MEIKISPTLKFRTDNCQWSKDELGNLCRSLKTGTLTQDELLENGLYPVVNGGRNDYGRYDDFNCENALTISSRGEAGHIRYIPEKFWAGGLCYPYSAKDGNTAFFAYQLISKENKLKAEYRTMTSIPAVNKCDVEHFELTYPCTDIQNKIAQLFISINNKIHENEDTIEKIKIIKSSMLSKMFPKDGENMPEIRFPGFTDAWEQRKFSDVFEYLQNNTLSRADLTVEDGVAKNVHYGDVLIKFGEYLDASDATLPFIQSKQLVDKLRNSLLKDGDVIMADTAEDETVGKCTEIAGLQGFPTVSGLHTIPLRPKQKFAPGYLGYYMNSGAYHDQLLPLMQGIKVTSISKSAVANTDIVFPVDSDEQASIGGLFIRLENLITLHQRKLETLKNIKTALLNKMFV